MDPTFEFSAPHFFDFSDPSHDDAAQAEAFFSKPVTRSSAKKLQAALDESTVDLETLLEPVDFTGVKKTLVFSAKKQDEGKRMRAELNTTAATDISVSSIKSNDRKRTKTNNGAKVAVTKPIAEKGFMRATAAKQNAKKPAPSIHDLDISNVSVASTASTSRKNNAGAKPKTDSIKPSMAAPALTEPKSPKFASDSRKRKVTAISSIEAEIAKIETERAEFERRKKQARLTKEKALRVQPIANSSRVHSEKPLTEPVEFHFASNTRSRPATAGAAASAQQAPRTAVPSSRTHNMTTRSTTKKSHVVKQIHESHKARGFTEPVPFSFASDSRIRTRAPSEASASASSPFKSVAEQVRKFQTKTPKRFHAKETPATTGKWQPHITEPHGFDFASEKRHRPTHFLSREQEEELSVIHAPKFKARPVDPKILHSAGDLGVPRVEKAPITTPIDLHFASDDRVSFWRKHQEEIDAKTPRESPYVFKAQPIMRPKTPQVRSVTKKQLTTAKTPNLATRSRASMRPATAPVQQEPEFHFKAQPMPVTKTPKRKVSAKPVTEPEPFSFELTPRGTNSRFQEEVSKLIEAEKKAREFHARPVPQAPPMIVNLGLPKFTEPAPFALNTERRGQEFQAAFKAHVDAELEQQTHAVKAFKAHAAPKSLYEPFFPAKSTRPLTEVENVTLNSDRRHEARAKFDAMLAEKDAAAEAARKAEEIENKKREAEEIRELRKNLVHKAQPVHKGNPVSVKKSEVPLTQPKTPNLSTKSRATVRA
eukprot:comp10170_c1_seq1/m.12131 comp10170_c1_seq1/g.12131  ORF comp10170_c1_seq1/g.12131 comp10170_c1_seq1/m.12131 type:complete len:766 (-) comp10170_c1_seq1:126-2423(-)